MANLLKLGGRFKIGKSTWMGPVVASQDALFLVKQGQVGMGAQMGVHGGLVGALIGAAIDAAMKKPKGPATCDVSQLPDEILHDPGWPRRVKKGDVLVVTRGAVEAMRHKPWSNVVEFTFEGEKYQFEYTLFRGKRTRAFLLEHGWPVAW